MTPSSETAMSLAKDPFRPRFHFSTPTGWLNDPNGLVYLDGEYHMFYQHNPDTNVHGPMYWGHAVSRDLVAWTNLPIALVPDALGTIFSGSAVIDHSNTAGFGACTMVAVFTYHRDGYEVQALAYSIDKGRTLQKYGGNPILEPPDATPDFRDPKVFWYQGRKDSDSHWVMLLVAHRSIWIYCSADLKQWRKSSEFASHGARDSAWECPELVELPVDGGPQTRWLMVVGLLQTGPVIGCGTQYFIGEFDGERFSSTSAPDAVRWVDWGSDFYAPQIWNEMPDHRRVWLAWMNNWNYANKTPTTDWRGVMSVPRELSLVRDGDGSDDGVHLVQWPIAEVEAARKPLGTWGATRLAPGENALAGLRGDAVELVARFAVDSATTASQFGLRVRVGAGERTTVGYDLARGVLFVDRSASGQQAPGFEAPQSRRLAPREGAIQLRLLVDRSSVEVFADGGRVVFTNQIFPDAASQGIEVFTEGGIAQLASLEAYDLGS